MKKTFIAALSLIGFLAGTGLAQESPRYRNFVEMTAALKDLAEAHRNIARWQSIGRSRQGRELWLLEIANPEGVPVKDRPALFIAANLEGDHLIGSEIALRTADYFLKNYPGDPDVKQRLDNQAVYIAPRVNPDGAELMFAPMQPGRKTNSRPRDDENDGRTDEDGPEDLNKDGFVTVMRVKAADGQYLIDPEEPRLMKKADARKGERGAYRL